MKKLLILFAALLAGATLGAQENAQYNQYGVKVETDPLVAEAQDGILVLRSSKDSGYKIWFDNRVQMDAAAYFGAPEWADKIGNGVSIRRARFAVKAQINPSWYGEVDCDFANGVFELKDAIIRYDGIPNTHITIGNFKEFFSIQRNNSSRYLQFMERPMVAQALAPSRHAGVNVNWAKKSLWLSGGVFFQAIEDLETRTYVEDANKDFGFNAGKSYTAKAVYMPGWDKENWGLHIAGAFSYREPKADNENASLTGVPSARFSTRATSSINRKKYIDTGDIKNVSHDLLYTGEFAGYYKGLRWEAVYMGDSNYLIDSKTPANLWGWYAQAGYLLFGGTQRYDSNGAKFTRVKRGRSWGDIELCGRYEYIDFNDPAVVAGAAQAYSLGLNYYINDHCKIMVNYQFTDNDRYANGKGNKFICGLDETGKPTKDYKKVAAPAGKAGVDFSMIAVRMEIDF